jgi:hypothetical protein
MFMSSSIDTSNLQSVRQALGIATLQKAMNQDAQTVAKIIDTMEETTAKTMEMSVTPHIGTNIDIKA